MFSANCFCKGKEKTALPQLFTPKTKKVTLFFCGVQIMSYLCTRKSEREGFPSETHCATYRGVEQLVARQAHNLEVACSSPAPATKAKMMVIEN